MLLVLLAIEQALPHRADGAGNPAVPTDDEVKNFLSGVGQTPAFNYICRCGSHVRVIRAIQQAAVEMS